MCWDMSGGGRCWEALGGVGGGGGFLGAVVVEAQVVANQPTPLVPPH